jgi:U4/U6.U5 tri-snRNP-associated protein 2
VFCVTVNFPVKNLELKDYIPLPKPKGNEKLRSKYDLIANIVHDGKPGEGCYRVFVQRKSEEAWYVFFTSFLAMYSSDPQV